MVDKATANHEYYEKHKERILAKNYAYEKRRLEHDPAFREAKRESARRSQARRRRKHREIRHQVLERPCKDCGVRLPPEVMEFDHVRGEKLFNICQSYGRNSYVSYQMLRDEIAKCDIRCPNCHRLRHFRGLNNGDESNDFRQARPGDD
jgi:hypothetical protein